MFCGNCGAKLRDDDRFCPKCGAKTRLARQMEQTPEETAVPASSSSSAESASNAGAKPRKTIRLKSVPTGQVQNDSKPEQVGPVKTEPEPAASVKEERQEKPPQQAAEPAGASESEPVYHASEPEQKDTADGESIRCGSCGATLKAGTKFCPECGTPTANTAGQNNVHTSDNSSSDATNERGQPQSNKATHRQIHKSAIIGIVSAVIVIVLMILPFLSQNPIESLQGGFGSNGGITDKTTDPIISGGLNLLEGPSFEVTNYGIEIFGKVEAESWIGSPVKVHVTFYDEDGAIVTTETDKINDMNAGDVWRFDIKVVKSDAMSYFVLDGIYSREKFQIIAIISSDE